MDLDTREKRASALGVALAFRLALPLPDGTVDATDRPHLAGAYMGITSSAPTIDPYLVAYCTVSTPILTTRVQSASMTWAVETA